MDGYGRERKERKRTQEKLQKSVSLPTIFPPPVQEPKPAKWQAMHI